MKRYFAATLLCLFQAAAFAQACDRPIQLGSWNIEWLGVPGNRTGPSKNFAQLPSEIASYIRYAKVDVLALVEIGAERTNSSGEPRSRPLDQTMRMLNQGDQARWTYKLFLKKDPSDLTQLTGVAWNQRKVKLAQEPFRIPLAVPSEGKEWERWATAVKLSAGPGKTDFVVVPIHMKSNRGGAGPTSQQRAREAQLLVDALPGIRSTTADQDIILLGDFNVKGAHEPAVTAYTNAQFLDLNEDDRSSYYDGDAPFDRIFVPANQPEFELSAMEVIKHPTLSPHRFKERLSDHYMVTTTLCAVADDD